VSRKPRREVDVQKTSAESVSWFPGPDDSVRLLLPGSQSIEIRPELDTGTQAGLLEGLGEGLNVAAALDTYRLRSVFAYLLSWTLPLDLPESEEGWQLLTDPTKEPGRKYLPANRFALIHRAIEAHEKARGPETPIVPVVLSEAEDAWFLTPDDHVTLPLPFGESLMIRTDLAAGTHAKILAALNVNAHGRTSTLELALRSADAYIVGWSLRYPDGRAVPIGIDSCRAMLVSKFSIISRTIQAYELALEARAKNPIGSGGFERASASVN
jgi:hypothetical protein